MIFDLRTPRGSVVTEWATHDQPNGRVVVHLNDAPGRLRCEQARVTESGAVELFRDPGGDGTDYGRLWFPFAVVSRDRWVWIENEARSGPGVQS